MTQPGSDEMVYRVLLEHANNSAKSSDHSVQSETNSASDLGGGVQQNINLAVTKIDESNNVKKSQDFYFYSCTGNDSDRCASFLSMESGRATSQDMEAAGAKYLAGQALDLARW